MTSDNIRVRPESRLKLEWCLLCRISHPRTAIQLPLFICLLAKVAGPVKVIALSNTFFVISNTTRLIESLNFSALDMGTIFSISIYGSPTAMASGPEQSIRISRCASHEPTYWILCPRPKA